MPESPPDWLSWARQIQSLAQAGKHYAHNSFERERAVKLLAIAAEIVARYSDMPVEAVRAAFDAQPGYVTPKLDVRAAVFRGDQLLMVREAIDGGWTMPGGWADVGEPPHLAVEREVAEESGLTVKARSLVGVYDANRISASFTLFHAYKLVFLCDPIAGEPAGSSETSQAGFFDFTALPHPFSSYRTMPRYLEDVWASHLDHNRPAAFD
jgi:ADP-ribose pyrophosphatase YjhB (NUDIX family)